MLPLNQKQCPMYDRFVPYLGKLADSYAEQQHIAQPWLIDIGANVGDTTAGLIRHTKANILAVEPTSKFFTIAKNNFATFPDTFQKRIKLVKAYIGQEETESYVSKINAGTAVKVKTASSASPAEAPTLTVPHLLEKNLLEMEVLSLIKVDTDGYDSECVLSLGDELQRFSPLLYWENEIDTEEQLKKFEIMTDFLNNSNYNSFFIFDNFGNYLCETDHTGMKDIDQYLWRIQSGKSARSFFYVDVLACKAEQREICSQVIEQYLSIV